MDPNPAPTEENPAGEISRRPVRWRMWLVLALVFGSVIAAGWQAVQSRYAAAEASARARIESLGGLVLSGGSGKHVGSVNLALIKNKEDFDEAVALVRDCRWLQILDLSKTPITDEQLSTLTPLRRLTSLQLARTGVTDVGLLSVAKLPRLSALHISHIPMTNAGLKHLGKVGSLTILDISGTSVSGDLAPLRRLKKLTWLVVRELPLGEGAIETFVAMPALGRLALHEGQLSDEQRQKLQRARPQLNVDTPGSQEQPFSVERAEAVPSGDEEAVSDHE